jgi:hypothetical protein
MKKLILLLTLTLAMMFGQTKLETRLYTISNLSNNEHISLSNLTEIDVEWYGIKILNFNASDNWYEAFVRCRNENSEFESPATRLDRDSETGQLFYNSYFMGQLGCFNDQITVEYNAYNASPIGSFDITLAITAEFPQEDTGYIEDGFDYCVEPGSNLMSYPCDSAVALLDAIPSDALSSFEGIIGAGAAATNLNGTWVGSITNLSPGAGYWIKSNSALCFNYDCSEN